MATSGGDGTIILTTRVDDAGISKGLSKLKSGVGAFGKAFAVAGVAGMAAFAGITKAAIDSYAKYEQLAGGVETLFKDSAEILMRYADEAYKTAGMSANQYMESVTSFSASMIASVGGDTAKAAELSNQAMIAISDNANKMGTDIESIVQTYQSLARGNVAMLDNLKLGYGGTKAELERLIEDAEAYKKSMGEIVDYDASNFADVTQAIQAIQEKLGIAGATAEEASTTIEGSTLAMKAAWENLLTGIVDSNEELPQLMDNFAESVVTVFDNIAPAVEKVLKNLPEVISTLGKKIIEIIPDMFGNMIPGIINGASLLIETIAQTIAKNAQKIGNGFVQVLKIISNSIINIIPTMIQAGKEIVLGIAKGISGAMPVLSTAVIAIGNVFLALNIASFVSSIINGFRSIMTALTAYQTAIMASQSVSILLASTLTPLQLIIGVLTGKVSLATAAQVAWNTVLNANPVMLAVGAVGLLAGAVVGAVFAYDSYLEKNSEIVIATQNIADAAQEAAEKTKELNDSLLQITENAETNILNLEAEAYANETLATELFDLAEQASLTASEKERMAYIVDILNNSVSDLNLVLDEETGNLNMTEDVVKNVIEQKLELAKANAIQSLYTEQLKEQYKAEANAIDNARNLKEAHEQLNEIISQGQKVTIKRQGVEKTYNQYTKEQEKAMDNLRDAIEDYESALETSEGAVLTSQQKMQDLATATGVELPQSFANAQQSSKGFFDALIQQTGLASSQSHSKGNDFGQGYVNGINLKASAAYTAGYNLGLQALKGIQDAQRSQSPAKETILLGGFFGEGYALGIKGKVKNVVKAVIFIVNSALKQMKISTKDASEIISSMTKELITDSRTEVQKVLDDMNEEMLESEKFYADESLRIEQEKEEKEYQKKLDNAKKQLEADKKNAKNSKELAKANAKYEEEIQKIKNDRLKKQEEKAQKEYLDNLKETAEQERKIYDARQKDIENTQKNIVNAYKDAADDILDAIEDLQKRQETLAKKLSSFGTIMEDVETFNNKFNSSHPDLTTKNNRYVLSSIKLQTSELERYYDFMARLKDREGMSAELFEAIANMNFEESFFYAKRLMQMGEKQFQTYVEDWQNKQNISKKITEDLLTPITSKRILSDISDQTNVLKDYYSLLNEVKNRGEIPQEFFSALRDMGIEEGLEYANALLELSDEDFANYIQSWEEKQKTSQLISKELYKDEAEQLATEIGDKFDEVEKEFFGVGENAAGQFENGFLQQLTTVVSNIKSIISGAFSNVGLGMSPDYGIGGYSINVPALARGSVLPGGKPFLAIVNDQPKGQTNIEAPLATIVDAMNVALNNRSGGEIIREEHYHVGETELMTLLYRLVKGGERIQGKSFISRGDY